MNVGNIPTYFPLSHDESDMAKASYSNALADYLTNVVRRAVDGSIPINLTTLTLVGNLKITTNGSGIIIPATSGLNSYLLTVIEVTNADGSIRPVLKLTKQ